MDSFFSSSSTSLHTHIAFADAHSESIYNDAERAELLDLLVFDDSVEVDWQKVEGDDLWGSGTTLFAYKWKTIYVFTLFVLLSLLPIVKLRQRAERN